MLAEGRGRDKAEPIRVRPPTIPTPRDLLVHVTWHSRPPPAGSIE
jgi:hypothetical protein